MNDVREAIDIEQRLLKQVGIGFDPKRPFVVTLKDFDAVGARVGGEHHHFAHERIGIHGLQLQFERARKIEKGLDDAIEAIDFGGDDLDMRLWILTGFEFGVQQFEVQHHGV